MGEHRLIVSPVTKRELESWFDIKPEIVIPTEDVIEEITNEPCPFCGCPGKDFDGHVCEEYGPEAYVLPPIVDFDKTLPKKPRARRS